MGNLMGKVRDWWRAGTRPPAAPVPFEVECGCGQVVRGFRQARHQAVRCPSCRRSLFVLPRSPLPPVAAGSGMTLVPAAPPSPVPAARYWLRPLVAAGITLAIVAVAFAVVLHQLGWQSSGSSTQPVAVDRPALDARIDAGKKAMAAGNFQRAVEELSAAQALAESDPRLLTAAEGRQLAHLLRQAQLLADLLHESLEEVLRHAAAVPRDEWNAVFARRFKGKAVVFDAEVRRDPASGQYHLLGFRLLAGPEEKPEEARLELKDLRFLANLPLDPPQRLLFGARLASAGREQGGQLVIRFDPASGVLLTDPGAASACSLQPLDDEMQEVLKRQAAWLWEK